MSSCRNGQAGSPWITTVGGMPGSSSRGNAGMKAAPSLRALPRSSRRRARTGAVTGAGAAPCSNWRRPASSTGATDCATNARRGAMQVPPPLKRSPKASARATIGRSAPGSTKTLSHPDSSMVAGTTRGANAPSTARPVAAEPVSTTWSRPASIARVAWDGSSPRTWKRLSGKPASASMRASRAMGGAQPGAGLTSTAFPAASACREGMPGSISG